MRGVYTEIVPPERLVSTEVGAATWPETLNTLLLSETGGKTTITQKVLYPSRELRARRRSRPPMQEGMSASFDRFAEYLATIAGQLALIAH